MISANMAKIIQPDTFMLPDGMYMVYPKITPPILESVLLTLIQTTTGGGTMLEGGVFAAPKDIDTGTNHCAVPEGDYVEIKSSRLFHYQCSGCSLKKDCNITGEK